MAAHRKTFAPQVRADHASLTSLQVLADGRTVLLSRQGPVTDPKTMESTR
jgi:hypothetical protein